MKKIIESKIKRGRVTCSVNVSGKKAGNAHINKALLKKYIEKIHAAKKEFALKDEVSIDTLINLPGVLIMDEEKISPEGLWVKLKVVLEAAANNLAKARRKEGAALQGYLKKQADEAKAGMVKIKAILKKSIKAKLSSFATDEERAAFLKDTDTTEEIDRLSFNVLNFKNKLSLGGAIGKEIDFIAQEMQREANTLAAKTFDVAVTSQVLKIKGLIEKIREQAQNIE